MRKAIEFHVAGMRAEKIEVPIPQRYSICVEVRA